ncbi:MAG: competence protein ComEC, partial [Bradymonadia bacterium]
MRARTPARLTGLRLNGRSLPWLAALALLIGCGAGPLGPAALPAPTLPSANPRTPVQPVVARSPYGSQARPKALADLLSDDLGPHPLRVHMVDIGQGDALLIESPGGKWILVDSGPRGGRRALLNYLRDRGVKQLVMAIATHAHSDHIANMDVVFNRYPTRVLLDSGVPHTTRTYARLLDALERTKVQLKIARKGRQITLEPGIVLRILGPEEPLVAGSRSDLNANSVIFRLEYADFKMLFTGDAEEETEQRLLADPANLDALVLKVAHHGSRHATASAMLAAVKPRIALISASKKNRYGHPAPETIQRLTQAKATIFETPRHGHVVLSTNGREIQIHTQKSGLPTAIVAAATADAPPATGSATGIDINTANATELKRLPGVGKATAKRIIDYRTENGPFRNIDDLIKVRGIGKKTLAKMRAQVRVSAPPGGQPP